MCVCVCVCVSKNVNEPNYEALNFLNWLSLLICKYLSVYISKIFALPSKEISAFKNAQC